MSKRWFARLGIALILGLGLVFVVPSWRVCLAERLRGERFYQGMPLSYWTGNPNSDAVPALIAALKDTDADVRYQSISALSKAHLEQASYVNVPLGIFIQALRDESPEVRRLAAWDIAHCRWNPDHAYVISHLFGALADPDEAVGDGVAEGLWLHIHELTGYSHDVKRYVPALLKELTGRRCYWAAKALADIGPEAKEAVPGLIAIHHSESATVRIGAADALKRIDPDAAARAGVR
jgi:HEAT repeat protein